MVLVKINTPVHYHVKKYSICKNKICQGPGTLFDGNMVVSAGMAHIMFVECGLHPSVTKLHGAVVVKKTYVIC